jgi:hypothetical protein
MNLDAGLEALVLAVLEKRVKERIASAKAIAGADIEDGQKRTFRSPLDESKLGLIWRTDPDPTWKVTDRAALCKALEDDPANVEYVDDIAGTEAEVIDVLAEHAPHLLARIERVKAEAIIAAVARVANGETPLPGIERVKPRGSLVVRPDKNAGPAIERMVAAGLLTWDGRLLELPAGASAEPSQPVPNDDTEASA